MKTPTEVLSEFVSELTYKRIPNNVVKGAKFLFLDFLGCALGGISTMEAETVRRALRRIDCSREATIWGIGTKASMINAVIANATAGEGRDFTSGPMVTAETNIIPASTAVAERERVDGRNFITSIVAGVEVQGRVLSSMNTQTVNKHGFYHGAAVGPFGATAAVGKILRLGKKQMKDAFGIAGCLVGGLLAWITEGIRIKAIQMGCKGAESIIACYLAKEGFPGPSHVIEADYGGLLKSFSDPDFDISMINRKLGEVWFTNLVPFKPYPCCRWTHPYIDCIFKIVRERDLILDDIVTIIAYGIEEAERNVMRIFEPKSVMEANFSLPFIIAVTLVDKEVTFTQFTQDKWNDGKIKQIARKVKFICVPEMEKKYHYVVQPPFVLPGKLAIRTKNGEECSAAVEYPKGMPENPMTDEELITKFYMQARMALPKNRVEKIVFNVMNLDKINDIGSIVKLLRL
jgi:2-methylcitrate dehydratase PrpD